MISNCCLRKGGKYAMGHPQWAWFLQTGQEGEPSSQRTKADQKEMCEMTEEMTQYCLRESSDLRFNSL